MIKLILPDYYYLLGVVSHTCDGDLCGFTSTPFSIFN